MSGHPVGRVQSCNRDQARNRLAQARAFLHVAELVGAEPDEMATPGVAAALAVLAGIAASDAACCAVLGQRSRGQDHRQATFFEVKNILGVGQARNRVRKAVERTVPFGLFCSSILTIWYALHGHDHTDAAQRRAAAPWYTTKTEPLHPGHAHQTPPPDHHRPIFPILPPTSHNPRNPRSPARLGPRRRLRGRAIR
jgi:hypothetical protein